MQAMELKDPISSLTHLIGVFLSLIGLILLIYKAVVAENLWQMVSFAVFGVSMILLYLASTLYHWLPLSEKGCEILRKIDHTMIFVVIGGTYTPVCLIPLRGPWGWSLFGIIWGLVLLGISFKFIWFNVPRWLSTSMYIFLGSLVIIAIWPLFHHLPLAGLGWLFGGGLFYIFGAILYQIKRPNPWPGVFGFHEIFHIFVIMGSCGHFWLMYRFIAAIK